MPDRRAAASAVAAPRGTASASENVFVLAVGFFMKKGYLREAERSAAILRGRIDAMRVTEGVDSSLSGLPTRPLAGLPLSMATPQRAAEWIRDTALEGTEPVDVHLVNAYTIALADKDDDFRALFTSGGVNLPDGKPLSWVTRFSKQRLTQVRGPGLFGEVLNIGRTVELRHYLLGSSASTLAQLTEALNARYPGLLIVGSYSPPFRPLTDIETAEQDQAIAASQPHVVWIGLGTPKQDFEAARLAKKISVMTVAVGAAFDFLAGNKREAPGWMQAIGLEWLFRLANEPRRLWRRYLFGNLRFIWSAASRRS